MTSPLTASFRMKCLSMKTRMALAVSLLFVVFAATIAFFSISYIEDKYKQSIASQQHALACAIASSTDDKLVLLQNALIAAGAHVPLPVLANADEAQRFLDDRITLHALFDNKLFLFDKEGTLLAESPVERGRRGVNTTQREYCRQTVATGKPLISPPYLSSQTAPGPMVMLTAPIFDSRGRPAFVLGGSLNLLGVNLLGDLPQMKIGRTGYVYLATSERHVIVHPDKSRVMAPAPAPGGNILFDRAVRGFDGSGETVNSRGIPMLASFQHLRTTNWIVGLNFPISEAYAPMYRTRQYLLAGIAAGTLAMLAIAWLTMRRLTLPLVTITRQVEAMREEAGAIRLPDSGSSDEIGTLATAFNRLIEKLDRQQEHLQEKEKTYRIVADNTYDWEFWLSPDMRFLYSSPSSKRITGIDAAQFLAEPDLLNRIIHPDDRELFLEHRHRVGEKQGVEAVEFRIVHAVDGTERWISHLCHPAHDNEGNYLGTRGSNSDITERKKAEEQIALLNKNLAEHAQELEMANRELEAFGYTVSHDLRAPLTKINLCCQVVQELWGDRLDEQCRSFILEIRETTERMDQLMTSLLDFSRISRREPASEPVDLSEMATVIAAELRLKQPDRRVTFDIAEGITVTGDEKLLRLALVNLLGNAWKYTGKKESAVIEFGVTGLDGSRTYFVRDNGAGFDMGQADKLFDAFQRLHSSKEFEGHGIGLATVQRIINRHGGRVWAEAEVGKGATLYFTLA